jgi:hypothetical protein
MKNTDGCFYEIELTTQNYFRKNIFALGHSQMNTTKIYAQVQNEGLRENFERLAEGGIFDDSATIQPSGNFEN